MPSAEQAAAIAAPKSTHGLESVNQALAGARAADRVGWALETFGERIVLASSFGVQAAVSLHLVTTLAPRIPVVLVDTGYLFPETYRFIDALTGRLGLNLKVYRPALSAAWQEARHGRLWEAGAGGIDRYNRMNKVEPMRRALDDLRAEAWFAGLRRTQAGSRRAREVVEAQNGRIKVHPIVDWSDRDVYNYLRRFGLPYHPLWHAGYVSIGDVHTTRRLADGLNEEETRFHGLRRECGLHEQV